MEEACVALGSQSSSNLKHRHRNQGHAHSQHAHTLMCVGGCLLQAL